MIIDIHTHLAFHEIFPDKFISGVAEPLTQKGEAIDQLFLQQLIKNSLRDKTGASLIENMDKAQIDRSVLLIADFGYALGEPVLSLESMYRLHYEVMKSHPDRFIVFGGVDPRRGQPGVDLFEKSISEYGFSGLKLYPPCGFELDHPGLYPLYEICSHLHIPVLTHTGPSLPCMETEKRYPATILKVSKQFPNVNFILAHAGARDHETTLNVAKQRSNVYFDISTFQATMKSSKEWGMQFRKYLDFCPEQIIFGSDWPMFILSITQKQLVEMIDKIPKLTSEERDNILCKNALRLLQPALVE